MAASSCVARFARKMRFSPSGLFSGCTRGQLHVFNQKQTVAFIPRCSHISTDSLSYLHVTKEDGYGIIEMKRKPVNSLSLEMLTEISNAIDELEDDKSCQGLILTSALPKIFSAGLDITEMVKPKEERLVKFWHSFQNVWLKLYGSRLATVAAINGASPAGGCLLAVSCDYRIMADGCVIGPNETQLGIVAPTWFKDTLVNTVGHRQTELMLSLGQLLAASDALKIGLVDNVLQGDVLEEAKTELKKWLAIPAEARNTTKILMRSPTLDKLRKERDEDTKMFLEFVGQELTQKIVIGYLKKLAEKSKK